MYLIVAPYTELLNEITTALEANAGIITLTGAAGTGKSAFCNTLARVLRQMGQQVVYFLHPPHSLQELQDAVRQQLALPSTAAFDEALTAWHAARTNVHQRLILLIDDADTMDSDLLAGLDALAGNQMNLVIAGTDRLAGLLQQQPLQPLAARISRKFQLLPLTLAQLRVFCREFLQQHGAGAPVPGDAQLKKLLQATAGLPGAVVQQLKADIGRLPAEGTGEALLDLVLPAARRPVRRLRRHIRWHVAVSFSVIAIAGLSLLLTRNPAAPLPPPTAATPTASEVVIDAGEGVEAAPAAVETDAAPTPATAAATAGANSQPAAAPAETVTVVADDDVAAAATTAVPAPAEAAPAPVPPALEVAVTQADVEQLLTDWTRAWQQQDLAAYFAAYAAGFVPANGVARERWQADRTRIIGSARDIRISWRDLDWQPLDADSVRVELALDYAAAGYRDVTRKRLLLQREAGSLRITVEENLAVERR